MGIIAPDKDGSSNNHKNKIAPNKVQKNRKTSRKNLNSNSGLPGFLIFIAFVVIVFFVIIKSVTSGNENAKKSNASANTSRFTETYSDSGKSKNQTGGISDPVVLNEILTEIGANPSSSSAADSTANSSSTNQQSFYNAFQNQNFTNRNYAKDKNGLYEFTNCVIDDANLLSSSQYSELCAYLVGLNKSSGVQIAVLTVKSLEGEDIESFSLSHAEKWGLGQRGVDNGALLVVAYDERAIRIETGYGTEAALTDAKCARIIRNVIAPSFQKGDYGNGIILGVKNMAGIITNDETLISKDVSEDEVKTNGSAIPIIVIMLIFFVFYFRAIIYGITHRGRRRGSGIYPGNHFGSSSGSGGFSSGSSHSSGSGFRGGGGHFGGGGASGRW